MVTPRPSGSGSPTEKLAVRTCLALEFYPPPPRRFVVVFKALPAVVVTPDLLEVALKALPPVSSALQSSGTGIYPSDVRQRCFSSWPSEMVATSCPSGGGIYPPAALQWRLRPGRPAVMASLRPSCSDGCIPAVLQLW